METNKVYFFCVPHGPADRSGYEHAIVCIAEGLRLLGIQFSGNIDYWQEGNSRGDYLIRHNPDMSYRDADIVVFSSGIYNYQLMDLLPQDLFSSTRSYQLVFIDCSDGIHTPGFREEMRKCDRVLKCQYNKKSNLPSNFYPWAFGPSMRILEELIELGDVHKKPEILVNYRVDHPLREYTSKEILPLLDTVLKENRTTDSFDSNVLTGKDYMLWVQTGRRHYPSYYRLLAECEACHCFGGIWGNSITHHEGAFWKIVKKINKLLRILPDDRIYQFDSWRFWESFVAGTCVFHVDLEKYGCVLPVMPKNMEHYLGFDLKNPNDVVDRVCKDPVMLKTIGDKGKAWALENYAPKAVAERFLKLAES